MAIQQQYIVSELEKMGYTVTTKSQRNISIMLGPKDGRRVDTLELIESKFKGIGAVYNTKGSGSTIGRVELDKLIIFAKPANRQGAQSAGIENEMKLIEYINSVSEGDSINIQFVGKNGRVTYKDITEAREMGRVTGGYAKSDVDLIDSRGRKVIGLSLKQADAEAWGAFDADKQAMDEVRAALQRGEAAGIVNVTQMPGGYFQLQNKGRKINVTFPISRGLAYDAVFGRVDDKKLVVIKQTFRSNHFSVKDDTIVIEVEKVYKDLNQIMRDPNDAPVWNVMNSATRNPSALGIKGLRPLVQAKSRARSSVPIK